MEQLLRRVEAIAIATGSKEGHEDANASDKNVDEFTQLKRDLNLKIREIRNDIKERDDFAESKGGREDKTEIIRKNANLRTEIKDAQDQAKHMRELVMIEEGKMVQNNQDATALQNRYKMCDLIDAHIAECEKWFKGLTFTSVKSDPAKRDLLKGAKLNSEMTNPTLITVEPPQDPTQTELEDIDGIEEWQLQIQENEQEIDSKLDQVLAGSYAIAQLADQIGSEYQALSEMDRDVDAQMDKTQANLDSANAQLKKTSAVLNAKRNCCFDITLILLLVACVGFILWKYVF